MLKRKIQYPMNKEQKLFCDFMGYKFVEAKNDYFVYEVPHNHICRFNLNFDRWKNGVFDKEKFLALLQVC